MVGTMTARRDSAHSKLRARWLLTITLVGCGAAQDPPMESAHVTNGWLAYDVEVPGRGSAELVDAFEVSAHRSGCETEAVGTQLLGLAGRRRWRGDGGIKASCPEGNIALIGTAYQRVRVGCQLPATREQCDGLLRKIGGQ
jgi:hypothetical protein